MSKRQRSGAQAHKRVLIDVGGTKITTTVATIERSSYLFGMIDSACWEEDADHVAEIFLDRDPDAFRVLLSCLRSDTDATHAPHDLDNVAC